MAAKKSFESALVELEKIVTELENSEVDLDKSISLFEKGMELSAFCKKKLDTAEKKVMVLSDSEENGVKFEEMPKLQEE